jgi:uncharacterized membrane protein
MNHPATPTRLETFSDAVFAILITIMVLELGAPNSHSLEDLYPLIPMFFSYALSFVYLVIYWNNHHQMLKTLEHTTGGILWANAHLLFWLSLIPFATGWLGDSQLALAPTVFYGVALLLPAIAYYILQHSIIASQGEDSILKKAIGHDIKGKSSPVLYMLAIICSLISPWVSYVIFVLVAILWIVPDKRIESVLGAD